MSINKNEMFLNQQKKKVIQINFNTMLLAVFTDFEKDEMKFLTKLIIK